jgi:putative PIN family toxin of toxin-antitoxin system
MDTNVLLRGLRDENSAAGRLLIAVLQRRILILANKPVLGEYRRVAESLLKVGRFSALTPRRINATLEQIKYFCEYVQLSPARFHFPRDPGDAKFIELAIAGRATHIISFDNDLLSLATDQSDAGKRFRQCLPNLEVAVPGDFMRRGTFNF